MKLKEKLASTYRQPNPRGPGSYGGLWLQRAFLAGFEKAREMAIQDSNAIAHIGEEEVDEEDGNRKRHRNG